MATQAKILVGVGAAVIGLIMLADWAVEYLWLEALGYASVFWTIRFLKVGLFVVAFLPVLAYLWINIRVLSARMDLGGLVAELTSQFRRRSRAVAAYRGDDDQEKEKVKALAAARRADRMVPLAAVAAALIFGLVFYGSWDLLLRIFWSEAYGRADPFFGHDVGFYLFVVPFLELLQNSLAVVTFGATAVVVLGYVHTGALRVDWKQGIDARPGVLRHVGINLSAFLLAWAWGYYLDRFALLQSTRGAVYGAGYTDIHVVQPALWIVLGATLALAAAVLLPPIVRNLRVVLTAVGGYVGLLVICLYLAPWAVQSFKVEPNELELEEPFLRHNIAFTRLAYGLDHVEERSYGALDAVTPAALQRNKQTIDNIRLWDWRPLVQTFRQLQRIRTYYEFNDVDVDRYLVDGAYRQVMVSARELSPELPEKAETWVNRHLQYTHGYGLAMSLAAKKTERGAPVLLVKDLPPRVVGGLTITRPAIYYGENMSDFRIVATSVKEFDYPRGDENVYTKYDGRGGILLDGFWKKVLFAWHQFDVRIALTSYTLPGSRIQLWRSVRDRVRRIAPFLRLDRDPYLVLSDERLYWIQDAYAIAHTFPYSEPHGNRFNYIRNSAKVVIDAYNGDVVIYVIDPADPVLGVYREALPALFRALDEMPQGLRRHLRYPQDLFAAQVDKYSTYHMTVPQVFYNGEDVWTVPRVNDNPRRISTRPFFTIREKSADRVLDMKPYYILMRLLGEERIQFLLMTPLTPINRDNMIAWMAARSDFPAYGQLLVYKLPKERLILGPIQVEAMIDQDTLVSQQMSLWDQRGSRVLRGNLLVIPIEQSFIYVKSVYLIAEGTEIPEMKRVIVSDGHRLAMEPTLEEALAVVFRGPRLRPAEVPGVAGSDALSRARDELKRAEKALQEGDWDTFGRAMQNLKRFLAE